MLRLRGAVPVVVVAVLVQVSGGCAPSRVLGVEGVDAGGDGATDLSARSREVARDPLGYLQEVKRRADRLEQYTLVLTRQERRGLFAVLREPERIMAWYRRAPLSIRFKWMDPNVKYGESTYVEGRYDNKVRFIPRHGLFGLKPGITAVDLQTPVIWGEARYPVTDFGLARLVERTLNSVREAQGNYALEYRGLRTLENGRAAHHLWMRFPQSNRSVPVQELFVDAATDLPALTLIKRDSGELEAAYQYDNLDVNVRLTDEDFLLDAERGPAGAREPG